MATAETIGPNDHAQHVRLLTARRERFGAALTAFLRIAKAEDHWVVGPEHLDDLEDLDAQLARLMGDLEALPDPAA